MLKRLAGFVLSAFLFCANAAQAADYRLDFTATNFSGFGPSPLSAISGSFLYSAPNAASVWTSLNGVDLTIADYRYSVADVGFSHGTGINVIGGTLHSVNTVYSGTNDFYLALAGETIFFVYGLSSVPSDAWTSYTVQTVITEVTAVPEPGTYAMLLAGLGLMRVVGRRRRNASRTRIYVVS
ncbi:PEP-CTERM sorting domain-containing protein [Pseudoduganella sp. FT26W]|uniref:PEP-CTERM sorting domain-containing protein n=1 Tax=Duganella aquatilis TaxID=2666082 RepID=A0A844D4Q6_9BURK|nr:FxDxF family PEP-CTERM protein [Duganella aquatilis]MRW84795.1 PEP-CTERM sorting domain-containing protein [Duganella aquatilis]